MFISLLCQPVGSVISGVLLERLGRKRSLLLVNIPPVVAWLLFYFARSKDTMFAAGAVMGFGMGFMEAPIVTYVAEISQPEIRGVLTSYAGEFLCGLCGYMEICIQIGFFVEFLFGSVTDWKMAAAISAGVPLVTILAITLVLGMPLVTILTITQGSNPNQCLAFTQRRIHPRCATTQ
uniref:(California timema) hypothetical protein n=1 Tax=Timema californicum TaxID=61474 RepID=A0A7R9P7V5_TIMCA|nr:unnamed protein product [Timema californicum]